MGKLLPQSQGNSIMYKFYSGHFIRALGLAYRDLIDGKGQNYLLVIDELNRGNAAKSINFLVTFDIITTVL
ncbi:MAG: hypothetical protein HWQ38_23885 [Nostoc sp. NMS7]|uniref:hypothetical protein n=1 Tax=Nostoc sp. NMS7 TaxID=2815391 RepID=UPI0025E7FFB9|nr:hypothetical protein [Nostoc sp. NMS7]MBN3949334.1 hypothetical protein [Nostoc sp. NMS7]